MIDKIEAFCILENLDNYKEVCEIIMMMGNNSTSLQSSLSLNLETYDTLSKWKGVYLHTLILTKFDKEHPQCYNLDEVFGSLFVGIRKLTLDFSWTKTIKPAKKYIREQISRQKESKFDIFSKIEELEIDLTWIDTNDYTDFMILLTMIQPKSKLLIKWKDISFINLFSITQHLATKTLEIIYTGFNKHRESGSNYFSLKIQKL